MFDPLHKIGKLLVAAIDMQAPDRQVLKCAINQVLRCQVDNFTNKGDCVLMLQC